MKDLTSRPGWLPDMDLNHDKQIQSLLCYRYTIGQTGRIRVNAGLAESRNQTSKFQQPTLKKSQTPNPKPKKNLKLQNPKREEQSYFAKAGFSLTPRFGGV